MPAQQKPEASTERRYELYSARLANLRRHMRERSLPVLLTIDPTQMLYATGASNMTLFTVRVPARYLLILAEGPTILFDYVGGEHLAENLPTISEIRTSEGLCFVSSGGDIAGASERFARLIVAAMRDYDVSIDRIGLDRFPYQAVEALWRQKVTVVDGQEVMSRARAIKLPVELPYIREAMRRVEEGVRQLEMKAEPDKTECEVWAEFHYALMAKEGRYIATRLFQSGPNTFPYFQEAGPRTLQHGDLLCLDTDAIAFEGYAVDFSRTFLCGGGRASPDQKLLYGRAREQLETNAALLKPGIEYRELAEKAWRVPEEHQKSRYYCIGHGLGMSGEFPNIPHNNGPHNESLKSDYPLKGHLEPGMIICLESYVGWDRSGEGVKLEDQFLIREDGVERLSSYPFDERLSGRS